MRQPRNGPRPLGPPTALMLSLAQAIHESFEERGKGPTLTELCRVINCSSTGTVRDVIAGLVRRGLAEREPRTFRGLRLTDAGAKLLADVKAT